MQVSAGRPRTRPAACSSTASRRPAATSSAANSSACSPMATCRPTTSTQTSTPAGSRSATQLYRLYDVNYSLGGPIMRDRLWFFISGRNWAYNNYVANAFNPDGSSRRRRQHRQVVPGAHHGAGHEERQAHRAVRLGQQGSRPPRAVRDRLARGVGPADAAGVSRRPGQVDRRRAAASCWSKPGTPTPTSGRSSSTSRTFLSATCRSAFAACPAGTGYGNIAKQDIILRHAVERIDADCRGHRPGAPAGTSHVLVASVSYVSGAHNLKVGVQNRSGWLKDLRRDINGDIVQQYRNGVPSAGTRPEHAARTTGWISTPISGSSCRTPGR